MQNNENTRQRPHDCKTLVQWYQSNQNARQFVRFCIVGAICTVLDASIYYTTLLFAPKEVALVCGYCLSLVLNYYLTIHWTFETHASPQNAVGIVGAHLINLFVVRMGLMYIFTTGMNLSAQTAYVPMLLISMVTNFLIIKLIVNRL